MVNTVAESKV